MRELGIQLICANSPQAKGRVERANATLQDLLVKELRLKNISDIESGNAFAAQFMAQHNKRFAKAPASTEDRHQRALPDENTLNLIFSHQCQRKLSKNLELSYNNVIYQVKQAGRGHRLRQSNITVCENKDQKVTLLYKDTVLAYERFDQHNRPVTVMTGKEISADVNQKPAAQRSYKPKSTHPWQRYGNIGNRSKTAAA
jgi:hypothetical protein